ncbi:MULTISPECIES: AraC family transcriptional regulator [unclassified Pseudomonas]|uniref:AraC family transcriptional regulator n=1 Tax=unclassified Pseudomonas TaxID=196821 RepID=UPI0014305558|nr:MULTISPECIES: AraC family transcriptional regulator [unclassified Pseudomonas]MBB6287525.1 AraC-like DNA-binding protein [Pseudomonas sp. SJZ073]MBB6310548.1 AraC-like DNA-binding protein [Pseudomonas sp. JAI120]NJJ56805.1 AraC family transcriptional regulator [Pseudomonas sp. B14(2022)]
MTPLQDKGTTSIALVHEALYSARQRQLDLTAALANADFDPQLLNAPKARVSATSFARLWVEIANLLDDEFFGIDSHPMRRGSFKLMCHALLDCPEKWPERDDLAVELHMSNSTLQRRLQAEGTHYQSLRDDLRRDMAIDLLSRGDMTVTQVAAATGFQETSAFHRAFKKWTGVSPGAYRRGHLEE